MNNKQNNTGGNGHNVSPKNASLDRSTLNLTHLNNVINITTHNVQDF